MIDDLSGWYTICSNSQTSRTGKSEGIDSQVHEMRENTDM